MRNVPESTRSSRRLPGCPPGPASQYPIRRRRPHPVDTTRRQLERRRGPGGALSIATKYHRWAKAALGPEELPPVGFIFLDPGAAHRREASETEGNSGQGVVNDPQSSFPWIGACSRSLNAQPAMSIHCRCNSTTAVAEMRQPSATCITRVPRWRCVWTARRRAPVRHPGPCKGQQPYRRPGNPQCLLRPIRTVIPHRVHVQAAIRPSCAKKSNCGPESQPDKPG